MKPPEEIFSLLLKRASAKEVKDFIESAAKSDAAFRYQFIIRFIEESGFSSEEKYTQLYMSIISLSVYDHSIALKEINHLLDQAEQFAGGKNYFDAFTIASVFINQYSQARAKSFAQAEVCVKKSFQILISIVQSDAGYDLKEKSFHLLMNLKMLHGALRRDWLHALITSATEEEQKEKVLELINELIGENRNQFGESEDAEDENELLKAKLQLLEVMRRADEAHHLLEAHRDIPEFRRKLIDECMQQKNFEQAKELIKEGKRTEQRKGKIDKSMEWDALLLKMAQTEGDTKAIRNIALQLFLSSEFDFQYFQLLKQQYDVSRWKQQVERITQYIRKDASFATKGIYAVAKIFIEEQEWEKLLLLLQKNSNLEFVDLYFDYLKEKFPEPLLEIYRKAVRRYAEKYMGPDSYRMVVNTLRKMQSLPGGREMVQPLTIELKVTYRQRKSFVDELNKIML